MSEPTCHLVVDARVVRPGATGVGHYVAGLLSGLERLLGQGEFPRWRVSAFRLPQGREGDSYWTSRFWSELKNVRQVDVPADYESHPGGDLWLLFGVSRLMKEIEGDVLVSPAFVGPLGSRHFAKVLGVLDTIAWDVKGNYPKPFAVYLKTMSKLSARSANRVFSLSPNAANRVRRLGIVGHKQLGVVPCAIDSRVFYPPKQEEQKFLPDGTRKMNEILLFVGSLEQRKNQRVLFEALRRDPLKSRKPELLLLCNPSERARQAVRRQTSDITVNILAPKSLQDIASWTRAADVAVFPSLSEGFGLPALEAMACGTPLVASDIEVMRWLTEEGKAATLLDPHNAQAWSEAIVAALEKHPKVLQKRERGLKRAGQFTWIESARCLMREVEGALSAHSRGERYSALPVTQS